MSSKGVILIGGPGKGTRFRPLSLEIPKPLFPISASKPILWHQISALTKLSSVKEVLIIGYYEDSVFSQFVKDAKRDFAGVGITYLREWRPLGTAGGLYHFRDTILRGSPETVFVINGDICSAFPLKELADFHAKHRGVGTLMGHKVPRLAAHKYGCVVIDPSSCQALHYVEKPESFISDIINTGVYLFDKSVFEEIRAVLEEKGRTTSEGEEEVIHLEQDVIAKLASNKKLYVFESKDFWRQIKTPGSAIPANSHYLSTLDPKLLRPIGPSSASSPEIVGKVFIHESAQVDSSAKIGPNVSVGPGVRIGEGCRVFEALLGQDVVMDAHSIVNWSIVGSSTKIGKWSRVEGAPEVFNDVSGKKVAKTITILANDVTVQKEVCVRSCIVLPQKVLYRSFADEVLL